MAWQFDSGRPIYTQLLEQIRILIISGRYPAGSKLPSVRDLALPSLKLTAPPFSSTA